MKDRTCHRCGAPATNRTALPVCDECRAWSRLRVARSRTLRPHGITVDQYDDMLSAQGGRCAICGTDDPGRGHPSFCVDHDHVSGAVRGLLCYGCNIALGHFADDPTRLRAAADYLER